jgi:hypothetical protein
MPCAHSHDALCARCSVVRRVPTCRTRYAMVRLCYTDRIFQPGHVGRADCTSSSQSWINNASAIAVTVGSTSLSNLLPLAFLTSCLVFLTERPRYRQHMNLPPVEPKQWSCKQGSVIVEEASEFVIHPPVSACLAADLPTKQRCDDAVSSSATHGSVSDTGASERRQSPADRTNTLPTSNGDKDPAHESPPGSSAKTHLFAGKALPTNPSSCEHLSYCLDRFLGDVDPREEARLGKLDSIARGRSRERRKDGAGRWRETRLKSRNGHCDRVRLVEEVEKKQETDGAA